MSSIYYYEPFFSYSDFDRLANRVFGNTHSNPDRQVQGAGGENQNTQQVSRGFQPKMDVHESTETNLVTATFELPGLKKEDVTIDVHNNRLLISGETFSSRESNKDGYVVKERRSGKFSRSLPLPSGTQADQIKASMENGVLTVTFPKSSPEQSAKRITIS